MTDPLDLAHLRSWIGRRDTAPFEVCGCMDGPRQLKPWARTPEGRLAMDAGSSLRGRARLPAAAVLLI